MEKRKILILGSDYGTLDLLREAHKMGLYVIVSDLMTNSPTKNEADEAWMISTTDIDKLEQMCRNNNVSAVTFGASDFNINNGRKLCKRLNLPFYCESDKAWEVACNKSKFKEICKKVGAPIAKDYFLSDDLNEDELKRISFPVVVKPVDKSGNRGMSYCKNETELIEAYKYARSVSDNSTIIVERELHGPEFAVNYVMADGEIRLLYFSSEHNEPGEPHNLYSVIDTTSHFLKKYINEINEKVKAVFKEAGCKDGIAWVETILDEDGHFYLLEMGYRFGGEMTYVPYEKVSGFNSIRWMLEIALGIPHTIKDLPKELDQAYKSVAASYYMFTTVEGEIMLLKGIEDLEKHPKIFVDCPKRAGNSVRYRAAMGIFRIFGEDIEDLCETISYINKTVVAKDKSGKDMFVYFTDLDSLRKEYYEGLTEFQKN